MFQPKLKSQEVKVFDVLRRELSVLEAPFIVPPESGLCTIGDQFYVGGGRMHDNVYFD